MQFEPLGQQAPPQIVSPAAQTVTAPQLPLTHWPAGQQPAPQLVSPDGQHRSLPPQVRLKPQQPPALVALPMHAGPAQKPVELGTAVQAEVEALSWQQV